MSGPDKPGSDVEHATGVLEGVACAACGDLESAHCLAWSECSICGCPSFLAPACASCGCSRGSHWKVPRRSGACRTPGCGECRGYEPSSGAADG